MSIEHGRNVHERMIPVSGSTAEGWIQTCSNGHSRTRTAFADFDLARLAKPPPAYLNSTGIAWLVSIGSAWAPAKQVSADESGTENQDYACATPAINGAW
jgi:hypothetical protein